ncbi:helix-turn-helix transcriptional regulator [Antarcticirhabdus aurantiaca]|uniref:AlpA family transcriptional regulator n=1 Tax=Antarcticirhabdus aurantiaca TaxID=2606717 RepID=A0ACD4NSK5_9HYPH|nr:AlpA family transcriptional regulator [Antarcticirhabdus aurantiaca]WAJ29950.1 AlpA family transcriptional regulator [Jeongeuplla avenae]
MAERAHATDEVRPGGGERLLRLREVQQKLGISRGAVYDRMANGTLPRPLQVGPGTVRWRESEIDAWIESLPRA